MTVLSLEESVNKFLIDKPVEGYHNNLNVFSRFLKEEKQINSNIINEFLQGLRTDGIIKSLDFYIRENKLTSIDTARRYSSCIREFFRYIIHKNIIENKELSIELGAPSYNEKSYTYKINNFIAKDKRLKESDGFVAISEEDVKYLIEQCDITLDSEEVYKETMQKQKYYNKFRSAIILKLILLTGIRYEVLKEIKKSDLNLKHDLITINNLMIHMPINLSEQLNKYEIINEDMGTSRSSREIFFIEYDGVRISDKTYTTAGFLKGILGRNDLNGVIKYTIIEMIKKGINESIIRRFTGVGDTMYTECQNYVNEMYNIKSDRYLDSKIRSMEIYDILWFKSESQ